MVLHFIKVLQTSEKECIISSIFVIGRFVWDNVFRECIVLLLTCTLLFDSPQNGDKRPSLPYFSEITTQKLRRNSLKYAEDPIAGTQKDELEFLREITGGAKAEVEEVRRNMDLFRGASFSTFAEDVGAMDGMDDGDDNSVEVISGKSGTLILPDGSTTEKTATFKLYSSSDNSNRSETSDTSSTDHLDQIVRLSSVLKSTTLSPEFAIKTEVQCIDKSEARDVTSFREDDGSSRLIHSSDAKPVLKDLRTALLTGDSQSFCLKVRSRARINLRHETNPNTYISIIKYAQKQTISSKSSDRVAKSSTYRVHFGNDDDDKIVPDDDFVHNDWDA